MGGVIPVLMRRLPARLQLDLHRPELHRHDPQAAAAGHDLVPLPLFLWALYATAVIQILATPVLGITVLLLIVERVFQFGIFHPGLGGDPVLYQHFFWFYSHPAVYIMILPAMGIISEIVSVFSRKHIFGYHFIAFSEHRDRDVRLLRLGPPHVRQRPVVPADDDLQPADLQRLDPVRGQGLQLAGDDVRRLDLAARPDALRALAFIFLFGIGGLTGLFLGALATDVHLHDTYFVVAHFHYVMMGSTLIAMIAGIHYWWPKMTGRCTTRPPAHRLGAGLRRLQPDVLPPVHHGQPRHAPPLLQLPEEFEFWHQLSTGGSYLMTIGFLLTAMVPPALAVCRGKRAPANPWGAATLEWQCSSPPPAENFDTPPVAGDPYDFTNLEYDSQIGGYVPRRDTPAAAPAH
jgi:cytochrome c oxidase subunit 1